MYCVVSSVKPPVNSSYRRIKFPRGKAKNGETQLTVPRALQSMDVLQGLNPNVLVLGGLMVLGIPTGTIILTSRANAACDELKVLGYEYQDLSDENFKSLVSKRAAIAKARLGEVNARAQCAENGIDADAIIGVFVAEGTAKAHNDKRLKLEYNLSSEKKTG